MTRSRLTISVDQANKIFTIRYIGEIAGDEINQSLLHQVSQIDKPWDYDTIVDMRRHDGTVLSTEIEDLGKRWNLLAQGRDEGRLIAIISEDPLVHARQGQSQAMFPSRILKAFARLDEGLEWIYAGRDTSPQAIAI